MTETQTAKKPVTDKDEKGRGPGMKAVKIIGQPNKGKNLGHQSISACMIVKNEEAVVGTCLDSIIDVVDEIIFLDTGSTDKTLEIAASYGDKVKILTHYKWNDDFSEARNESQKHATKKWIMIIDADEYLELQAASQVQDALKRHENYKGITCQVVSSGVATLDTMFPSVRFFKREAGLIWGGIVHNQLSTEGISVGVSELRLIHTGYDLCPEKMEAKFQRTLGLLKKHLEKGTNSPFTHCDMARSYAAHKDWHAAIHHAERALELAEEKYIPAGKTSLVYLFHLLWTCYNCIGDKEQALLACIKGLRVCPNHPDIWHNFTLSFRWKELPRVSKWCAEEFLRSGKDYMQNNVSIPSGVVTLYDVPTVVESLKLGKMSPMQPN